MSKALQEKINELFEATKELKSFEEIKPHCDRFNEWLNDQSYSQATLGTKLSSYSFYKKFKSLDLKQGENAEVIAKHDAEGHVKGHELKHYAVLLCGLNKEQWNERNQSTRVIDRLENSTEIDPDSYLETTGKLLASQDSHELAVGLVAATGRRPHEIIARAKFTAIKDKPYHIKFEGQGKKRGEKPIIEIPTLYPAEYVIKALARLEQMMQQMMEMIRPGTATVTKPQEEVSTVPREKVEPARKLPEPKQDIDWESIPNDQLRIMKTAGAVEEKIYRAFRAIANYNDNAPSNDDRWYIGSVTLSSVSGCNRQAVGDWIKSHHHIVDDHNNKYGLGQYHNKRHKGVEITDFVKLWEKD